MNVLRKVCATARGLEVPVHKFTLPFVLQWHIASFGGSRLTLRSRLGFFRLKGEYLPGRLGYVLSGGSLSLVPAGDSRLSGSK